MSYRPDESQPKPTVASEVKLPKIDVPTFKGNIMEWQSFWEQFDVSVHSRSQLTDPERLAYLRQALKDGPAKRVIEGFSGSGSAYREAIDMLQKRYDRTRLLYQSHVQAIVDAPVVKEGNGKDLRWLHGVLSQHLRALKAMDCEPSGKFLTSMIELKQDHNTIFEWQGIHRMKGRFPTFRSCWIF